MEMSWAFVNISASLEEKALTDQFQIILEWEYQI